MHRLKDNGVTDYYRLFQISPAASQMDIINAYRHAKLAYQQDSLAVYSLFSEQELDHIRLQVEEAYRVLSDPEKRRDYDALYTHADLHVEQSIPAPAGNVFPLHQTAVEQRPHAEAAEREPGANSYGGSALRRAREAKNITLEAIAEHTKVSKRYLQAIENEDVENFPEAVYLKGYLRQYSREIGLDPDQVVQHYTPLIGLE